PRLGLVLGGRLAVGHQVGNLEVVGVLGQLLDRVAAVAEDAGLAVEVGDGAGGDGGGHQGGVVEPDARHQLPPLLRRDATVDDGYLYGLSRPVVGDRYGLSHSCPPTSECTGNARDSYPLGRS